MSQVIITVTLLITGLFLQKQQANQNTATSVEVCLETNGNIKENDFYSKQNIALFRENENLKK